MNKNNDIKKDDYYCKDCDKKYKTYKTLWEHNKKFHNEDVKNVKVYVKQNVKNVKDNVKKDNELITNLNKALICNFCNKIFNTRAAKSIHKKKCQVIIKGKNEEIEKIKRRK